MTFKTIQIEEVVHQLTNLDSPAFTYWEYLKIPNYKNIINSTFIFKQPNTYYNI